MPNFWVRNGCRETMGPCTVPSAQTCPTPTPAPWRNRRTPRRRSDILSAPPMLAWPCKRQKTIDRLWSWGPKMTPPDRRCHGFSMVPGTILNPYTHIAIPPPIPPPSHDCDAVGGALITLFCECKTPAGGRQYIYKHPPLCPFMIAPYAH